MTSLNPGATVFIPVLQKGQLDSFRKGSPCGVPNHDTDRVDPGVATACRGPCRDLSQEHRFGNGKELQVILSPDNDGVKMVILAMTHSGSEELLGDAPGQTANGVIPQMRGPLHVSLATDDADHVRLILTHKDFASAESAPLSGVADGPPYSGYVKMIHPSALSEDHEAHILAMEMEELGFEEVEHVPDDNMDMEFLERQMRDILAQEELEQLDDYQQMLEDFEKEEGWVSYEAEGHPQEYPHAPQQTQHQGQSANYRQPHGRHGYSQGRGVSQGRYNGTAPSQQGPYTSYGFGPGHHAFSMVRNSTYYPPLGVVTPVMAPPYPAPGSLVLPGPQYGNPLLQGAERPVHYARGSNGGGGPRWCQFGLDCRFGRSCRFSHDNQPPCPYGQECSNSRCNYCHRLN